MPLDTGRYLRYTKDDGVGSTVVLLSNLPDQEADVPTKRMGISTDLPQPVRFLTEREQALLITALLRSGTERRRLKRA
jgi:hypothetical protein